MQSQARVSNTQVLVPLNSAQTLKNHIHVAVRLKPLESTQVSGGSQKKNIPAMCPWSVFNANSIRVN